MQVHAYGKINLYLDVLGRRSDGYTNVETIFQTVSLCDTLTFEKRSHGISMACSDTTLEADDSNLIIRAAKLLQEQTGCDRGIHVHLDKRIPVAGGMAGGSVDAAATLVALNELWGLELDERVLHRYALELGSDVPYCLTGGTVAATGRGEVLEPLEPLRETWFVLVQPRMAISAGSVYSHPALTRNQENAVNGRTPSFDRALGLLREGNLADMMFNRMESAILAMRPELAEIKRSLVDAGCSTAIVSGSGPTAVGLCQEHSDAQRVAAASSDLMASAVRSSAQSIEVC